jgi:hypothetical protein
VAGSTVHKITENWDLRQLGEEYDEKYYLPNHFADLFDVYLAEEAEKGREVKASGRKLLKISDGGGPNKKDRDWWYEYGPQYVQRYIDWRDSTGWEIAYLPDGRPGIEVPVSAPMDGEEFLGFIDRVFLVSDVVVVVDLKTGNVPPGSLQLGTYKTALVNQYGINPEWGAYWMGKDGDLTPLKDLSIYSDEYVQHLYAMARKGIDAAVFLPNITSMCKACPVAEYCRAVGGKKASLIPVVEDMTQVTS